MNKHHAKEELCEEKTSRRTDLQASVHKDICHVQEMIADMHKTAAGSQRNELMMSIHKDIHLVKQKLANLEKMVPKSKVALELSRAKPWRKATKGAPPDLFARRERRFKALREALNNEASMGKMSKTRYAAIWMELDDTWHNMMARVALTSLAKRIGKTISGDPMNGIDAHLDELEFWISAL
jgi:hypothetical protein